MKKRNLLAELIHVDGVLQNSSDCDDVTAEDEEKWADKISEIGDQLALNMKRRQAVWNSVQKKWCGNRGIGLKG